MACLELEHLALFSCSVRVSGRESAGAAFAPPHPTLELLFATAPCALTNERGIRLVPVAFVYPTRWPLRSAAQGAPNEHVAGSISSARDLGHSAQAFSAAICSALRQAPFRSVCDRMAAVTEAPADGRMDRQTRRACAGT